MNFFDDFFLQRNEIISWGKKRSALFQTHNQVKFFSQRAGTCICTVYTQIRDSAHPGSKSDKKFFSSKNQSSNLENLWWGAILIRALLNVMEAPLLINGSMHLFRAFRTKKPEPTLCKWTTVQRIRIKKKPGATHHSWLDKRNEAKCNTSL